MIWATVSSWPCFCWLYRASPSLAAKNIINLISVLTIWWWMGEFNSDDHYIYYCKQESFRRNGVAIMVNKRVQNAVLGCNLKNDRMISVRFQGKPFKEIEENNRMGKTGDHFKKIRVQFSSVQFSRSVVSNSLRPHESQHARPPCPSPTPRVHSDSRPSSQWCHPAISSSVIPFSSCPQSFPASESFPMSQLFTWGGQSTGVSALASFLPKKSPGWSPSQWTGWISLQSKGLSGVFSNTTVQKQRYQGNILCKDEHN